jgi:membrane protease YdiL (CAAX protease family)
LEPAAPRPRVWTVFVAWACSVAIMLTVSASVMAVFLIGASFKRAAPVELARIFLHEPFAYLGTLLLTQLVLGAFILALSGFSPEPWRQRLRWRPATIGWAGLALAAVAFLGLSNISDCVIGLLGWQDKGTLGTLNAIFRGASPGARLFAVGVVGLVAPVVEELFFRGYIQTRLVRRWGRWAGICVTSLLFGLSHLDPLQSTCAVTIALFLGWIVERTGSVWPTILLHCLNNTLSVVTAGSTHDLSRSAFLAMLAVSGAIALVGTLTLPWLLPSPRVEGCTEGTT